MSKFVEVKRNLDNDIKIIDYDMVEEENLGRQFLYSEADIGLMKTDVARRAINQINSQIEVEVHNLKIKEPEDLQKYLGVCRYGN